MAAVAALSGRELHEWMGHADLKTTQRYLHYRTCGDEAGRIGAAFAASAASGLQALEVRSAATRFGRDAELEVETLLSLVFRWNRVESADDSSGLPCRRSLFTDSTN